MPLGCVFPTASGEIPGFCTSGIVQAVVMEEVDAEVTGPQQA